MSIYIRIHTKIEYIHTIQEMWGRTGRGRVSHFFSALGLQPLDPQDFRYLRGALPHQYRQGMYPLTREDVERSTMYVIWHREDLVAGSDGTPQVL